MIPIYIGVKKEANFNIDIDSFQEQATTRQALTVFNFIVINYFYVINRRLTVTKLLLPVRDTDRRL